MKSTKKQLVYIIHCTRSWLHGFHFWHSPPESKLKENSDITLIRPIYSWAMPNEIRQSLCVAAASTMNSVFVN